VFDVTVQFVMFKVAPLFIVAPPAPPLALPFSVHLVMVVVEDEML
jgi:hypothetical protein